MRKELSEFLAHGTYSLNQVFTFSRAAPVALYFWTSSKVSMADLGIFLYTISNGALQVEE